MAFSAVTFPATVPQCGTAELSWTTSSTVVYPVRVELYYQQGNGPWQSNGRIWDVTSSSTTFIVDVPAGMTVWPTIVGNDGSYSQVNTGSLVTASTDSSCLATSGTTTVTETTTAAARPLTPETVKLTTTQVVTSTITTSADPSAFADGGALPSLPSGSSDSTSAAGTNTSEMGSFQSQQLNAGYKTATSVLGAFLGLALLCNFFLLFIIRCTRRRKEAPLRPRLARFTDDGSFMSERSTLAPSLAAAGGVATLSSNPFADPEDVVTPTIVRSSTLRSSLGFGERRLSNNLQGQQPPVSELFLAVPPRTHTDDNNSVNDLSRMETINSVDDRQGLQGLYVRNHSQFTLNSNNTE